MYKYGIFSVILLFSSVVNSASDSIKKFEKKKHALNFVVELDNNYQTGKKDTDYSVTYKYILDNSLGKYFGIKPTKTYNKKEPSKHENKIEVAFEGSASFKESETTSEKFETDKYTLGFKLTFKDFITHFNPYGKLALANVTTIKDDRVTRTVSKDSSAYDVRIGFEIPFGTSETYSLDVYKNHTYSDFIENKIASETKAVFTINLLNLFSKP